MGISQNPHRLSAPKKIPTDKIPTDSENPTEKKAAAKGEQTQKSGPAEGGATLLLPPKAVRCVCDRSVLEVCPQGRRHKPIPVGD